MLNNLLAARHSMMGRTWVAPLIGLASIAAITVPGCAGVLEADSLRSESAQSNSPYSVRLNQRLSSQTTALSPTSKVTGWRVELQTVSSDLAENLLAESVTEAPVRLLEEMVILPAASTGPELRKTGLESPVFEASQITAVSASRVSYAQIEAQAPPEFALQTDNEFLGEYLRQNPQVRWWRQNKSERTIESVVAPEAQGKVVHLSPSGGDDTRAIHLAAKRAGAGGVVQGNGEVFRVNRLRASVAGVSYKDLPMQPSVQEGYFSVQVTAPDVTFIRSPLDLLGRQFSHGFIIRDDADRFAMVDGGVMNSINTIPKPGALMRVYEGVDDIYIVGNVFKNSFASASGNSVRGIWWSGPEVAETAKRGIIASNLFTNFQSSARGYDADGFVVQGFGHGNVFSENLLFLANTGINAGKRLVKAQSGGIDLHGNFNWWKDSTGPQGVRVTRAHYSNHGVSNCRWTNNIALTDNSNPDSESFFMKMQNHVFDSAREVSNVIFKNNVYRHNETTEGNRSSYGFLILDRDGDRHVSWPINSTISDNTIEGEGELKFVYWFRNGTDDTLPGPDPRGAQFTHHNNQIEVKVVKSIYRERPTRK